MPVESGEQTKACQTSRFMPSHSALSNDGFRLSQSRSCQFGPMVVKPSASDDVVAVGVRGGRGLLDEEAVFVADAVLPRPRPELAHRRVVPAEAALGVNRHRVRPAGFGMNQQAVPVRVVAEKLVMIVNRQVAERLAEIEQEPVALFAAVDDPSGDDRQPRQQIIAAALAKFRAQRRRPVDVFDFPTVRVEIFQRIARERPGVGDERLDHGVPITLKRAGVIDVNRIRIVRRAGRALPAFAGGRNVGVIADGAAEAENLPVAGGHVPSLSAPFGVEIGRQVNHVRRARVLLAGRGGKFLEQRRGAPARRKTVRAS